MVGPTEPRADGDHADQAAQAAGPGLSSIAASGAVWTSASRLLNQTATTIAFLILARLLTPEAFGLVAMAGIFVGVAAAIIDFGFGTWVVQRQPLRPQDKDTAFWATLAASFFMAALFVSLAPVMASLAKAPDLTPVLRGLAVVFPLSGLSVVQAALLTRDFRYRSLAIRSLIGTIVGLGAATAAALAGWGVWSLVLQTVVSATVSTAALWLVSPWRPSLRFSRDSFRNAIAFGVGVLGVSLLIPIWDQLDTFLVGAILGTTEAGQYAVGRRTVTAFVGVASGTIAAVSLPVMARLKPELSRLRSTYVRLTSICVAAAALVLVPVAATGPELVQALFGPTWAIAGRVCQLLAIAQIVGTIGWVDRSVLFALGRTRVEFLLVVLAVATVLVAVPVGASFAGVVGAAVAMVIRQVLVIPIRLTAMRVVAQIEIAPVLRQAVLTWLAVSAALAVGLGLSSVMQELATWPRILAAALAANGVYLGVLRLVNPSVVREVVALSPRGSRSLARMLRL